MNTIETSTILPKIATSNSGTFITEKDDLGLAKVQVDKIRQSVWLKEQFRLKPWQKDNYSSIYTSSGKTNHQIIREIKKKYRFKNKFLLEMNEQKYYNKGNVENINEAIQTINLVKTKFEIKNKYKEPSIDINAYLTQTRKYLINNMIQDLVLKKKREMNNNELKIQKALKIQIKNLEKDIEKFDKLKQENKKMDSSMEKQLNKFRFNKKCLSETYKKLVQENNTTKDEMKRILKIISVLKRYTNFINRLNGIETNIILLNDEKGNIASLFRNKNDDEISLYINKLYSNMNNFLNESALEKSREDLINIDNRIELIFKIMEDNILEKLKEKEKCQNELTETLNKNIRNKNKLLQKYEEVEKKYKFILSEYNHFFENGKTIYLVPSETDFYNFMKELFIDLYKNIISKAYKKKENDIDEYNLNREIIVPTIKMVKSLELQIDELINEITKDSEENEKIIDMITNKIKKENKSTRYLEEKNLQKIECKIRREAIIEKMNSICFIGKCKFQTQIPFNILKLRINEKNKIKKKSTDYELLDY